MAKRASKRVSERKKTRTATRLARKEAKVKKEAAKKHKQSVRVPKSYLMTDEEKEQLKSIKESTARRTKDAKPAPTEPEFISEMKRCLLEKKCDAFLEVVDFRDIESSRNRACEALLKENSVKIFMFVNFSNDSFELDCTDLGIEVIRDFSAVSGFSHICVFGNRKVGKFLLTKHLEEFNKGADFTFVRTPVEPGLSALLRGHVDPKDINPEIMFKEFWSYVEPETIREYYMLGRFDSCDSFLSLLSEKLSRDDGGRRKAHNDAALAVFKDIIGGKIRWIRRQGGAFEFAFPVC